MLTVEGSCWVVARNWGNSRHSLFNPSEEYRNVGEGRISLFRVRGHVVRIPCYYADTIGPRSRTKSPTIDTLTLPPFIPHEDPL